VARKGVAAGCTGSLDSLPCSFIHRRIKNIRRLNFILSLLFLSRFSRKIDICSSDIWTDGGQNERLSALNISVQSRFHQPPSSCTPLPPSASRAQITKSPELTLNPGPQRRSSPSATDQRPDGAKHLPSSKLWATTVPSLTLQSAAIWCSRRRDCCRMVTQGWSRGRKCCFCGQFRAIGSRAQGFGVWGFKREEMLNPKP
jgi:hypothetical protein